MGKHGGMYGAQWRKARIAFLREHPFCAMCGKALRGADAVVDHIRPHRGDPVLFWDENNWQALCKECHDRKTLTEDINPTYQSFGDSADALKNGQIDAAFIVAGAPTTAITDLSTSGQVYLVAIDDEHVDKLIAASPYYSAYTVTADTYGMPEDVQTVAVAAVVLVRDDVSDDAVYTFVSTIFNNIDAIAEQHGKGAELNVEFAANMTSVPYHPGAAKYFAEQGLEVATK